MNTIELIKKQTEGAMEMFLRNFSHVPEDRLDWAPAGSAKTPRRIAAHTALYASRFATMIRTRSVPQVDDLDAWIATSIAEELALLDRAEIARVFRAGTAEVLMALDSLTETDLGQLLDSGQGWSISMHQFASLPALHAHVHTGQIDYLQTCWDDQQIYVE